MELANVLRRFRRTSMVVVFKELTLYRRTSAFRRIFAEILLFFRTVSARILNLNAQKTKWVPFLWQDFWRINSYEESEVTPVDNLWRISLLVVLPRYLAVCPVSVGNCISFRVDFGWVVFLVLFGARGMRKSHQYMNSPVHNNRRFTCCENLYIWRVLPGTMLSSMIGHQEGRICK